jgi:hypothetical protein
MHQGKNPDHRSIATGHAYNIDISQQRSFRFVNYKFIKFRKRKAFN